MTDIDAKKRPSWIIWMHIAGVCYPAAIWAIVVGVTLPEFQGLALAGLFVFTVATAAFIGGWGRYLSTKS